MLMPKRMKHRKHHRGRMRGKATRGNFVAFGEYAIIALEPAWVTSRQIEAARIAMTRTIKRGGKVWIRIFPDKPYTKKPLEQRMGKGKAGVEGYVAVVKPGRVMFEMAGPPLELARHAMKLAIRKLPLDCKFVTRDELNDSLGIVAKVGSHHLQPVKPAKRSAEDEATSEATEETTDATETVAPDQSPEIEGTDNES
jgi:large subunit ribosomal protein L16